jgi:hypothetical protein
LKLNYHDLPRKIVKVLKKIYGYLNNTAYVASSNGSKRKFFNVTLALVALVLISGFMLYQVMSAIQLSSTISTVGTLKLNADMGVYQDSSFSSRVAELDWGTLAPGATKSYSVYVRNEGSSALTLSMSTANWSPSPASNYLALTWNSDGRTVNAGEAVRATFTLTVSDSISGISSFGFDINLVGSG